jgi:hypothetical protein
MCTPFPKRFTIWSGAILGGIVNAIMTAKDVDYAFFRGWSRNTYVLRGGDGRDGAITFAGGHWYSDAPLVAAFYDVHGRNFHDEAALLEHCFQGCPPYQRSLANGGALRFLLFEGPKDIRATAAFWDAGDEVTASDPWDVQLANGADLITAELIEDHDAALAAFEDEYQLTSEQLAFVQSVFKRKLARPADHLELSSDEVAWLASTFEDPKDRYAELDKLGFKGPEDESDPQAPGWWESIDTAAEAQKAMKECRELFAEMGIEVPDKPV